MTTKTKQSDTHFSAVLMLTLTNSAYRLNSTANTAQNLKFHIYSLNMAISTIRKKL